MYNKMKHESETGKYQIWQHCVITENTINIFFTAQSVIEANSKHPYDTVNFFLKIEYYTVTWKWKKKIRWS